MKEMKKEYYIYAKQPKQVMYVPGPAVVRHQVFIH